MGYDRRLGKKGLENEPALGATHLVWGYDDVRDEPAQGSGSQSQSLPSGALGDEPALAGLAPPDSDGPVDSDGSGSGTYGTVYRKRRVEVTYTSQLVVLSLIAVGMIPLPLVGLFVFQVTGTAVFRVLAVTMLFPVVLEMLKPVVGLAVVEGRPWLVPGRVLLVAAHVVGGIGFGAVLYGLRDIGPLLLGLAYSPVRLLVAMTLHGATAFVSGLGVARVWKSVDDGGAPPVLRTAVPYLVGAVGLHAAYSVAVWAVADSSWAF